MGLANGIQDVGTQVKCHRCLQEFQLYMDTHPHKSTDQLRVFIGGMCPRCNARVTTIIKLDNMLELYGASLEKGVAYAS